MIVEFISHFIPGSIFIIFAFWWAYSMLKRYFSAMRLQCGGPPLSYRNSFSFPTQRWPNAPIEGVCVLATVIVGIAGQMISDLQNEQWIGISTSQYVTIMAFFGICGTLDIIYALSRRSHLLPPDLDYAAAVLAFAAEAFIIHQNLWNRSALNSQLYVLLYLTAGLCASFTALEFVCKGSLLPALGRSYFTMLQGTWLIQIAFILYGPFSERWSHTSCADLTSTSIIYAWHMGFITIVMIIMIFVICNESRRISAQVLYISVSNLNRAAGDYISDNHSDNRGENEISENEIEL